MLFKRSMLFVIIFSLSLNIFNFNIATEASQWNYHSIRSQEVVEISYGNFNNPSLSKGNSFSFLLGTRAPHSTSSHELGGW